MHACASMYAKSTNMHMKIDIFVKRETETHGSWGLAATTSQKETSNDLKHHSLFVSVAQNVQCSV